MDDVETDCLLRVVLYEPVLTEPPCEVHIR
jgi:hypothetical protein